MSEDTIIPKEGTPGHLEYATPLMRYSPVSAERLEVWERTEGFEVSLVNYARDVRRNEWQELYRSVEQGFDGQQLFQSKQSAVVCAQSEYSGWKECIAENREDQQERHRLDVAYVLQQPSVEMLDRIAAAESRERWQMEESL